MVGLTPPVPQAQAAQAAPAAQGASSARGAPRDPSRRARPPRPGCRPRSLPSCCLCKEHKANSTKYNKHGVSQPRRWALPERAVASVRARDGARLPAG